MITYVLCHSSLWCISQIKSAILDTTCTNSKSSSHLCRSLNQIAIDNVQVSAFFQIFNCPCHVVQNMVYGSLLINLTPQNRKALVFMVRYSCPTIVLFSQMRFCYSFSQLLWCISQIKSALLDTICTNSKSSSHLCTSLKQFLIPLNKLQLIMYKCQLFFHIINCSCHVDQNIVDGSLLNSLTLKTSRHQFFA